MKKISKIILAFCAFMMVIISAKAAEENAASIGDSVYETLQEAVSNAKEGETIKILKNLDLTDIDWYVFNLPDNSALDLNGYAIKSNSFTIIYTGKNITIKNGIFETDQNYSFYLGDEVDTDNVLIENVKFNGGLNIYNSTNVVIKNVSVITGKMYYAVWADQHAQITIESGDFKANNGYAVVGISKTDASIKIKGGNFVAQDDKLVLKGDYKLPEIYGGTFNTYPSEYVVVGPKVIKEENGYYAVGYAKEVELPTIDKDKVPAETEVGVENTDDTKEILKNILEKENIQSNTKVIISESKIKVDEDKTALIKQKIQELDKSAKITDFFDISINLIDSDTNKVIKPITNLDKKIKFSILLPENLQNKDSSVKRTYYILRDHENSVEVLDTLLESDGKSISFESDKFSTYAIAYVDTLKTNVDIENPKTIDGIFGYLALNTISMITFVSTVIYINKKKVFD